jgi:cellulose synthase/poly-beta-1,6-N-acetylglucosamine synthase-like glycosyltransferase
VLFRSLRENLLALASLNYPDYELIVTARAPEDVAISAVPSKARIVYAGDGDDSSSEKVNNLMAAVLAARPESQVFAFADSDGRVSRGWLTALVRALETGGAATGYRWYMPESPTSWNLMRSVWNAVIAGGFGPGPNRFVWGGAMAIGRTTFFDARVPEFWKDAVSDDYALTAAVRRAGLSIAFAPGAMVACLDGTTAAVFLGWIRRQMLITRVYYPRIWRLGLFAHLVYCGSMIACVYSGSRLGLIALAAQLALGMWKGARRMAWVRLCFPEYAAWFQRYGWVHIAWTPAATWIWLYSLLVSAVGHTIQWRGRRYHLQRHVIISH